MTLSPMYKRFLTVVDDTVAEAEEELQEEGKEYSCRKGCSYCCHMLVETTWDEAYELGKWVLAQDLAFREEYLPKIREAAAERASFFDRRASTKRYRIPTTSGEEVSERVTNKYFTTKSRPCPLLRADGACSAYEARPSACRMHVVTSPAEYCSRTSDRMDDTEIPDEVEDKRERVEAAAEVALPDPRWGELSIMLHHALEELLAKGEGLRSVG